MKVYDDRYFIRYNSEFIPVSTAQPHTHPKFPSIEFFSFHHTTESEYNISEASTGFYAAKGATLEEASRALDKQLDGRTEAEVQAIIDKFIKRHKSLSPRYRMRFKKL